MSVNHCVYVYDLEVSDQHGVHYRAFQSYNTNHVLLKQL